MSLASTYHVMLSEYPNQRPISIKKVYQAIERAFKSFIFWQNI